MVEQAGRIFLRKSIFDNSEPLIDFTLTFTWHYHQRHTDRKTFSEVRGKEIKQSATREELMQVSDRLCLKKNVKSIVKMSGSNGVLVEHKGDVWWMFAAGLWSVLN